VRSWFLPRANGAGKGPIFESQWEREGDDFAIGFLNLIETYAASFCKKSKVKHTDIRRAQEILKEELDTPHPFAHAELSAFLGRIIHERDHDRTGRDRRFIDVISRQLVFPEFRAGLAKIDYSPTTEVSWSVEDFRRHYHQSEDRLRQAGYRENRCVHLDHCKPISRELQERYTCCEAV
jgi:hypothetical protein